MDEEGEEISPDRRATLLNRLSRQSATVGQRIPETIEIDGQPFALREFVVEAKTKGEVPEEDRSAVREMRSTLERERASREKRLRSAPLTAEAAQRLATEIIGLDRAITALSNLSTVELAKRSHEEYVNGARRWVDFVDQLTG